MPKGTLVRISSSVFVFVFICLILILDFVLILVHRLSSVFPLALEIALLHLPGRALTLTDGRRRRQLGALRARAVLGGCRVQGYEPFSAALGMIPGP